MSGDKPRHRCAESPCFGNLMLLHSSVRTWGRLLRRIRFPKHWLPAQILEELYVSGDLDYIVGESWT